MHLLLLDAAIKSALLLLVVVLVAVVLWRASAALRHFVWLVGIVGVILVPVFSVVLPGWDVLPPMVPGDSRSIGILPMIPPAELGGESLTAAQSATPQNPPPVVEGGLWERESTTTLPRGALGARTVSWSALILFVWLVGALLTFLPTLVAFFVGWRRVAKAQELWREGRVRVLRSEASAVPLTLGVLFPVILLPADSPTWTAEKRRIVLLHELAHVKRWDCLALFLGQVARAIYWFNPLVWFAAARLRVECERACDDVVLQAGEKSSKYASTLLHYASLRADNVLEGGLAMARFSTIEGRLRAVLDPARNRSGLAVKWAVCIFVLAAVLTGCMSMLRTKSPMTVEQTSIGGRVFDQDNKPLEAATVMIFVRGRPELRFVTTKTDAAGKWTFENVPPECSEIEVGFYHPMCLTEQGFFLLDKFENVAALRDGSAVLKLERGVPVTVKVLDERGEVVADAKVGFGRDDRTVNSFPKFPVDEKGRLTLGVKAGSQIPITVVAKGFSPDLRKVYIEDVPLEVSFTLKPALTLAGRVVDTAGKPLQDATIYIDTWRENDTNWNHLSTNEQGEFVWDQAPEDTVYVTVMKEGYAEQRQVPMVAGQKNEVTLAAPTAFRGTVVYAESGKPVEKFRIIRASDFGNDRSIYWRNDSPKDGKNGSFEESLDYPDPAYRFRVEADGYSPVISPSIPFDGKTHEFTFKLVKGGSPIEATVTVGNQPVENAEVIFVTGSDHFYFENGRVAEHHRRNITFRHADKAGRVAFPAAAGDFTLLAIADQGFAKVTRDELAKSSTIALSPWARVEGTVRKGTKIAADQEVNGQAEVVGITAFYKAVSDAEGRFAIDRIFPGELWIGRYMKLSSNSSTSASSVKLTAEAGKTHSVTIGGVGRPVVGRMVLPASLAAMPWVSNNAFIRSKLDLPKIPYPENFSTLSVEERKAWYAKWAATDEGKKLAAAYDKYYDEMRHYTVAVAADGSFHTEEVLAGTYVLTLEIRRPSGNYDDVLASGSKDFVVPTITGGVSDEALDLGEVVLKE